VVNLAISTCCGIASSLSAASPVCNVFHYTISSSTLRSFGDVNPSCRFRGQGGPHSEGISNGHVPQTFIFDTPRPVREQHGKDASYHPYVAPDAVAFAQSTKELSEIVKICAHHKVPLIPFGAGTGLEGNVLALRGGVCIDLSGMNQILQVNTGDLDATVKAGVTHEQLDERLRHEHLFFSVRRYCTDGASVGGRQSHRLAEPGGLGGGPHRGGLRNLRARDSLTEPLLKPERYNDNAFVPWSAVIPSPASLYGNQGSRCPFLFSSLKQPSHIDLGFCRGSPDC
jgi:hypothetical protein